MVHCGGKAKKVVWQGQFPGQTIAFFSLMFAPVPFLLLPTLFSFLFFVFFFYFHLFFVFCFFYSACPTCPLDNPQRKLYLTLVMPGFRRYRIDRGSGTRLATKAPPNRHFINLLEIVISISFKDNNEFYKNGIF